MWEAREESKLTPKLRVLPAHACQLILFLLEFAASSDTCTKVSFLSSCNQNSCAPGCVSELCPAQSVVHRSCLPQAALMESSRLKEPLTMLQLKKDLLIGVFGQERATALLEQVAGSVRDRDLLHNSLLQRKSKLQVCSMGRLLRTWPGHGAGAPAGEADGPMF